MEAAVAAPTRLQQPVKEVRERNTISFMGVELPKAKTSDPAKTISKSELSGFTIEKDFAALQLRDMATAFRMGKPFLMEGGTSLGKSLAVYWMAAQLGAELHYVNLNGLSDPNEFMAKLAPNTNRDPLSSAPEYIYKDMPVVSGLRQEPGKIKIIFLDEYNAMKPQNAIRLHEVLDVWGRGGSVRLVEADGQLIPTSPETTFIVAAMNPPGGDFVGREPVDPANLRRWVYWKAPDTLPDETRKYRNLARVGLKPQVERMTPDLFLPTPDNPPLTLVDYQNIQGLEDIWVKFDEFHTQAVALLKRRSIGRGQPQQFEYNDSSEPEKVERFIRYFHKMGDNITIAMQRAIRYVYVNKLLSETDRSALRAIADTVTYTPPRGYDRRIGLSATPSLESIAGKKGELMRKEKANWETVLGKEVTVRSIPDYLTDDIIENLRKNGLDLMYLPEVQFDLPKLQTLGAQEYVKYLETKYPGWKALSMDDAQIDDSSVSRNLPVSYYEQVKSKEIKPPSLPGKWIAVESMGKPYSEEEDYSKMPLDNKIFPDLPNRMNVSYEDIIGQIQNNGGDFLDNLSIYEKATMRLPKAEELNLLFNKWGYGATDTYEWTSTEVKENGTLKQIQLGSSDEGGAAGIESEGPKEKNAYTGFRTLIEFNPV